MRLTQGGKLAIRSARIRMQPAAGLAIGLGHGLIGERETGGKPQKLEGVGHRAKKLAISALQVKLRPSP